MDAFLAVNINAVTVWSAEGSASANCTPRMQIVVKARHSILFSGSALPYTGKDCMIVPQYLPEPTTSIQIQVYQSLPWRLLMASPLTAEEQSESTCNYGKQGPPQLPSYPATSASSLFPGLISFSLVFLTDPLLSSSRQMTQHRLHWQSSLHCSSH